MKMTLKQARQIIYKTDLSLDKIFDFESNLITLSKNIHFDIEDFVKDFLEKNWKLLITNT